MKQDVKCNKKDEKESGPWIRTTNSAWPFRLPATTLGYAAAPENYAMAFSPPSSKGSGEIFRRFPIDTLAADVFLS